MDDDFDDDLDDEVNDIISQIKNQSRNMREVEKEKDPLKKEDVEDFIIQNAANIVRNAVSMVDKLTIEVNAGADSKMIESVSELVKATTSAIDALTKLKIAEDKNKNQKEITQMNIDAKITKDEESPKGYLLTRDDVIKALMSKPIDVVSSHIDPPQC
jgi:hypothetical protein